MPEGDTIFKTARTLQRALAGQHITRFETGLVQLARVDRDRPLAGRTVERVEAAGKHLLMTFSGDLILRTHMRMNGSWHIYRPGERWQLPRSAMRIVIETPDWVAVAFRVHVAEFIRGADLARHRPVAELGPDLLADRFDLEEALRRLQAHAAEPIAEVLLDQRVLAGIGNIYKSETLFVAGVHPGTAVGALDERTLRTVIAVARRLLSESVAETPRRATARHVYSRGGQPCRQCGTPIASRKSGDDARVTYWCPTCQPLPL